VGVEYFEVGLRVVEFVLGLYSVKQSLKLDQGTIFLLDENDLADFSEIAEYIIDTIVIIVIWN
jgi:hypothetical protein